MKTRTHMLVVSLPVITPPWFPHSSGFFTLPFFRGYQALCTSINSPICLPLFLGSSPRIGLPVGFWVLCRSSKHLSTPPFWCARSQLLLFFQHQHLQFQCSPRHTAQLRLLSPFIPYPRRVFPFSTPANFSFFFLFFFFSSPSPTSNAFQPSSSSFFTHLYGFVLAR